MKTKRMQWLLPIVAFTIAIAGAFATVKTDVATEQAFVPGYIDAHAPCMVAIECTDVGTQICRDDLTGPQAWGKASPNATTCAVTLYRP